MQPYMVLYKNKKTCTSDDTMIEKHMYETLVYPRENNTNYYSLELQDILVAFDPG